MKLLRTLLRVLILPVAFLHEGLHYLAARLVGVKARRDVDRVWFVPPNERWKNIFILMTPFCFGAVLFLITLTLWVRQALAGVLTLRGHLNWSVPAWMFFWWMAACLSDIYQVWHLLRGDEFCRNEDLPEGLKKLHRWSDWLTSLLFE